MKMPYSQYLRIESAAGGIGCTPKEFIQACHSKLMPSAKGFAQRKARHAWIRDGLRQLRSTRRTLRDSNL